MNRFHFVLFLGFLGMLMACSGNNGQAVDVAGQEVVETPPEPVLSLGYEELFDLGLDGKLVEAEGYLELPMFAMFVNNGKGKLDFCRIPERRLGPDVDLIVEMGDCENCLAELPDHYEPSDLHLKAADGTIVGAHELARIKGRLHVKAGEEPGDLEVSLDVEEVQKAAARDAVAERERAIELTPENLEDSTLAYKMVKATGILSLPSMAFMSESISLALEIGDEYLGISILIGEGPNQVERLPEEFGPKDFKVHGHDGKLVDWKRPVQIFGYRSMPGKNYTGSVTVVWLEQAPAKR